MAGALPRPLSLTDAPLPNRRLARKAVKHPIGFAVQTLANAPASRGQRRRAAVVCAVSAAATILLLPMATEAIHAFPGFVVISQSALLAMYGFTAALLLAQYRSTRSVPFLVLGAGTLYTALAVLAQLVLLPNMLASGPVVGQGSATLTWLWVSWHLGPPLFVLLYAVLQGEGRIGATPSRYVSLVMSGAIAATCAAAALTTLAATRYVGHLPGVLDADDGYRALTTSGVGPALVGFTGLSFAVLCWATKLRSVLQLWLGASLFLILLDNIVTDVGAMRGTVGWFAGRAETMLAALIVLRVYLREIGRLWNQALADTMAAQNSLEIALDATGMGDFDIDLASDTSRRTLRHDQFFGYSGLEPAWGWARTMEHIVAEDREAAANAFKAALLGGGLHFECRIRRASDGVVRWVAVHGRATYDAAGRPRAMAGCLIDVTERRQTEARLREAERMEAVGQLTGGMAHDFNNLLTVILGNLEMIARRPGDIARVERLATSAFAAGRRGAEMTDRLLSFSRRQMLSPRTVDLNGLLTELLPLVRHAVSEAVFVEMDLDAGLEAGFMDPSQIQAAILNLAGNARDAMPDGGQLTIRTRNLTLGPLDTSSMPHEKPGSYLHVSVSDTGSGMDAASAARAFEPFFTTKDIGKGTGLGLSQVYGFVRQAGGFCGLTSSPGQGCVVDLYLPRSLILAPALAREALIVPLQHAERGEVVLIVEDQEAVQATAAEALAGLGYAVLRAPDARAALDLLRGPDRIDILFSDVVMPGGMNGAQLAVEARTIRPGLHVLLTSGYAAAAGAALALPEGVELLRKPYLSEDLSRKLRM